MMFPRKAVRSRTTVVALGCLVLATTTSTTEAFWGASTTTPLTTRGSIHRLFMRPTTTTTKQYKKKSTATYAVQVEGTATSTTTSPTTTTTSGNANAYSSSTTFPNNNYNAQTSSFALQTLASILYASGLVTCNTVGAGMLVLPEVCAGPGMTVSTLLFVVWYVVNLASGSLLAHVAMEQQKQTFREEAPSSFQEFTKANLQGMEHVIAAVSLIKNALVLAFGTMQAGVVLQQSNIQPLQFVDSSFLSIGWAAIFCGLVGTCSASALSQLATVLVVALFGSFAALIVGSGSGNAMFWNVDFLAHVYALPPTADDIGASLVHAAPIVLMSFIYQNIVPTVVRMLDYRPTLVYASLTIGSAIPAIMYWIWCVVVLGSADSTTGATATTASMGGAMGTLFSLVTIAGSQLGSSTSMAEELDAYLTTTTTSSTENSSDNKQPGDDPFSGPAAILPGLGAVAIGHVVAQDHLVDLLEYAGAFGSPLLYFVLPVVFWVSQQRQQRQQEGR